MRRVERLILGSPIVLRTITSINVVGRRENRVVRDWMAQFAPGLRYGNPMLVCDHRALPDSMLAAPAKAAAEEQTEDGAAEATADAAAAAAAADAPAADAAAPTTDEAAPAAEAEAAAGPAEQERIELAFSDGSSHSMNLALYRQSHQVMQRIVELDAEKGLAAA
eukprot:TRINITY_DN16957_c0_g1_i1.p1 TRINITY_DN16957_c0_g1~~TRINITY_DN16957_c0_g1_i1.p1  ORF type:complete len:165 (-),score=54.66 TRINITY_DN16957_c0_g1_i1:54-548(-)